MLVSASAACSFFEQKFPFLCFFFSSSLESLFWQRAPDGEREGGGGGMATGHTQIIPWYSAREKSQVVISLQEPQLLFVPIMALQQIPRITTANNGLCIVSVEQ